VIHNDTRSTKYQILKKKFYTKFVDKFRKHISGSITFFNRAIYETMWNNIVEPCRPQTTIWRMRIACWIPKATDTPSEYVPLIAFPLQHWLHERAVVLVCAFTAVWASVSRRRWVALSPTAVSHRRLNSWYQPRLHVSSHVTKRKHEASEAVIFLCLQHT
jgi:hypothetical protein